jgi:hypothetical protein
MVFLLIFAQNGAFKNTNEMLRIIGDYNYIYAVNLATRKSSNTIQNNTYYGLCLKFNLALEKRFFTHLAKFDAYLKMNRDRRFIDGNTMTAVDCNILPKLHIAIVVAKALRQLDICAVRKFIKIS